jgi:hypothetical protein
VNHEWHDFIQRYIAGTLPDDEALALQNALKSDKDLRALYLDYMNLDVALGSHAESRAAVNEILASPMAGKTSRSAHWLSWRPLAAASAAGILVGMFFTSVVFGYVVPRTMERVRTVFSESFESGVTKTVPGLPHETSLWMGDEAEVVASAPGSKAHGGAKMLRFVSATYPGENSPRSQWGDVYRLVDVRGMAGEGRTMARLSASFAQSSAVVEKRFVCRAEALAIDKELSALPTPLDLAWLQQNNSATGSRRAVLTGTGQWQDVSVEVPITRETRYVMLHLAMVQEQPIIESGSVQFPAHLMDDVKLDIISDR